METEAKAPLSVSHASHAVAAKRIIPTTPSVIEDTNAERMD
jgi:hypothetical protein